MTVQVETPLNGYIGDGIQDTFAFTFRLLKNADLEVTVDSVLQVEITDYTIQNLTDLGGDVVFEAGSIPGNGTSIVISRSTSHDQQIDYNPFDAFPAETHELALDKLTMIVQELSLSAGVDLSDVLSLDPTKIFWDAESKRIKNLVQPQDANDAVTKQYADDVSGSGFDPTVDRVITGEWEFTQVIIGVVSGNPAKALDEVITGAWDFEGLINFNGSLQLAFNEQIKAFDSLGISHDILDINPNNFATVGSETLQGQFQASTHVIFTMGGIPIVDITQAGVVLENEKQLQSRNAADNNSIDLLRIDNANLIWFGSQSENMRQQVFSEYDFRVAGVQIARWTASNLEFKNTLRCAEDIHLQFVPGGGKRLRGIINESPGTDTVNLIGLDSLARPVVGDKTANLSIEYDVFATFTSAGVAVAQFTQTWEEGSLLIADYNGDSRKVGFRNPGARVINVSGPLVQGDEGNIVQCEGAVANVTIPALEENTQITIINRQNTPLNLIADAGLTDDIEWFGGAGSFPTGNRIVAGGSVVHVRYRTGLGVSLWGNGIT